ncbi:lysosomal alpha-glucosidase-like [Homarus americanus]|uniref:lysosomal alpha-glucosidase-like n=1 Tax=Homarus americanus TaxID=6706 RepID=UPI001C463975|nr:lysosomal alpha-glucosidase-like [Homarus americanus]XP_042231433.1 lysosomal alpha-glucosidase-like [Homarus americanus]XP_042231434.1 lysosomal alpha-glucosidase-like [Homarus americanus]XP_042231435.1 lysosomal alpha-glucosidase-like [Homarus americanus]XP_042231436.1 lysosomal alpha-glucosidase-like [Homarus americanus]
MVQYQIQQPKGKAADVLLGDPGDAKIKPAKKHFGYIWTALAILTGLLLTASTFLLAANFQCAFRSHGNTKSQHRYTVTPNDLQHAKEYGKWVKNLPYDKSCGIYCLFYMTPSENEKHEEPEVIPVSGNIPAKIDKSQQCTDIPLTMRFDCHPDNEASQTSCEERGCCWKEEVEIPERQHPFPAPRLHRPTHGPALEDLPLNVPFCYYPRDYQGYSFVNYTSEDHGYTGYLKRDTASGFFGDINVLKMDVFFETETRLRIKITDPARARWETPIPHVPDVTKPVNKTSYGFEIHEVDGAFTITRKSNGLPIFDTLDMAPLTYAEQFLQLSTSLPSEYIYGFGEHLEGLLLDTYWKRRVLWNVDEAPVVGNNLYGSHPFYLALEPGGNAHGVFLLNSNALDVVLQPHPALTMRALGGIIDLYVFLGPTPNAVISQYTEVIGRPFLPPYWSLGYHQCRYGYGSVNRTHEVWQRTRNAGIPFDVQWNDIDYMKDNKDFTVDDVHYGGLSEFVNEVHLAGMHYVPIIDPGISAAEQPHTYPPWDEGVSLGVFIRNSSNMPFIGKVWNPVATTWPDFTHPLAAYYWGRQMMRFHNQIPIDGAWIDMNEPSNFWSGSFNGCKETKLEKPDFVPPVHGDVLFYHTLCMSARHHLGLHYNLHNLFGFTETIATNAALQIIRSKRPFIISRSTYPGQGHYGGHWTGDVYSDWFNLWQSIAGILNFNMYGIPMVGADICGFNGNTTANLCLRWMQLGAFYPFSRNHNTDDAFDQDPVALGEDVVVAARNALTQRYMLLPYLYSLFFNAHLTGEPVARPLFFQFLKDRRTYAIDTQFMWGPALMISPVLKEHVTSVQAYIPHGFWYDWYDGNLIEGEGDYMNLDAPRDKIPLLVRGGYILPVSKPANTTTDSRKNGIGVLVAPSEFGRASGEFYWDDGEAVDTVESKMYSHVQFVSGPGIVNFNCTRAGYTAPITLDYMYILNVSSNVTKVDVSGRKVHFQYDESNKVLSVSDIGKNLLKPFTVTWK